MSKTANIKVNLPPASQSRQDFWPDVVNIAVDKSGAVWQEKKEISLADLGFALSNRFRPAGASERCRPLCRRRSGHTLSCRSNRPIKILGFLFGQFVTDDQLLFLIDHQ
jgi:hypothetical protein